MTFLQRTLSWCFNFFVGYNSYLNLDFAASQQEMRLILLFSKSLIYIPQRIYAKMSLAFT